MQRRTATIEECKEALRKLNYANWRRLDEMARVRATGLKSVEGCDLLQEAMARMLQGKRKWPLDVPLILFLRETMRSIASNQWRRQEDNVEVAESEIHRNPQQGEGVIAMASDISTGPEAGIEAAQTLARIEEMFEDDEDALAIIFGKIDGKSPGEIQQETEMSARKYATTLRRIRRRWNRFSERRAMI